MYSWSTMMMGVAPSQVLSNKLNVKLFTLDWEKGPQIMEEMIQNLSMVSLYKVQKKAIFWVVSNIFCFTSHSGHQQLFFSELPFLMACRLTPFALRPRPGQDRYVVFVWGAIRVQIAAIILASIDLDWSMLCLEKNATLSIRKTWLLDHNSSINSVFTCIIYIYIYIHFHWTGGQKVQKTWHLCSQGRLGRSSRAWSSCHLSAYSSCRKVFSLSLGPFWTLLWRSAQLKMELIPHSWKTPRGSGKLDSMISPQVKSTPQSSVEVFYGNNKQNKATKDLLLAPLFNMFSTKLVLIG